MAEIPDSAASGQEFSPREVACTVNGRPYRVGVEPRKLLSDFLREDLALTGTHVGCEHGVCGACTVLLNGRPARSCLLFAVQVNGADLVTVEGLASPDGTLTPLQESFSAEHALQCGFCTPGMLVAATALLRETPHPTAHEVRNSLSGQLCRCTGYEQIVRAVLRASGNSRPAGVPEPSPGITEATVGERP